ncbi:hypothetical protein ACIQ7D_22465, partial [Streptomyces sp. NPDC096310]|uniref:hypothetical protein n=1 Tax=Streptomyces sp. NPDC096310 TaxID=3366082 RepID=UPI00382BE36B
AGCDRHYGSVNVCVPTVFPETVTGAGAGAGADAGASREVTKARCAWLAANDYGRLKVNGKDDPLRLDPDRDGLACGKGDLRTG